jgi:hypothetical protein
VSLRALDRTTLRAIAPSHPRRFVRLLDDVVDVRRIGDQRARERRQPRRVREQRLGVDGQRMQIGRVHGRSMQPRSDSVRIPARSPRIRIVAAARKR